MPVKQAYGRGRVDPIAELKAWRTTFKSGFDYLRALPRIGVEVNERHQPHPDLVREAWARLGTAFLAEAQPEPTEPWALRTFGDPDAFRKAKPSRRRR